MVYIVMGVSGSGKTTVGQSLAQKLQLPFYDADDFHSAKNIAKMKAGVPLTDDDREDWLQTLAEQISKWQVDGGVVLACSALKEVYRRKLVSNSDAGVQWIFLKGSKELIMERLRNREGHFMNAGLLESQFEILEEPEYGIKILAHKEPTKLIKEILSQIKNTNH